MTLVSVLDEATANLDQTAHGVEDVPLRRCVGPAEVIRVHAGVTALDSRHLQDGWRPAASRVLVRTDSHPLGRAFENGFTGLSAEFVHRLADAGVELVGVDTPSVDLFSSDELPAHHALLERGMTWIEGLWLEHAPPGMYELVALPMLLVGAEAAPVRAVLRPMRNR